jgi:hypothetical protein
MNKSFAFSLSLAFAGVFVTTDARAEVLCYRPGNNGVVQVLPGRKCPRSFIKVGRTLLGGIDGADGAEGLLELTAQMALVCPTTQGALALQILLEVSRPTLRLG